MASIIEKYNQFLIDTHVLLWWFFDDPQLSRQAYDIIQSPKNTIWISAASGWEIATKYRLGKLRHAEAAAKNLPELLQRSGMDVLPISLEHALAAGELPGPHKDPFDRMLIAQGKLEGIPIVTADKAFNQYPVMLIW
jgi:PIN domain nuclease of toxin-antitoxin system